MATLAEQLKAAMARREAQKKPAAADFKGDVRKTVTTAKMAFRDRIRGGDA